MLIVPNQPGTRKPYSKSLAVSSAMSSPLCSCHWLNGSFEPNTAIEAGDMPLWVSTAGLGVSWLHVRLDARPKYYRHDAYTDLRA